MLRLNRYRHSVRSKLLYPSHFALAIGLILVCTAGRAQGQAVVGDLLVVKISAGSIVNIRNGRGFTRGIAEFEGKLLYSDLVANAVIDFTAGGDLSSLPVFANVTLPGSLLAVPGVGLFTASGNTNDVDEISAGGDFRTSMPFASGLIDPFGMVYVPEPLAANLQWTALATLVATASWRRRAVDR